MTQTIGIDLGTAYLKAAYVNKEGFVELLKDKNGNTFIPSIVAISPEKIVVGRAAKDKLKTEPASVVKFPLRHLADADWLFQYEGKDYQATLIVAFMLKYLKREIEAILEEDVLSAVITIPSYFGDIQRRAVMQAASIAGLEVLRIVNEATAVGLAYVHMENIENEKMIVCNLGDGAFEVSAMNVENRGIKVLFTSNTNSLTGRECKAQLADYLDEKFREETSVGFDGASEEREVLHAAADRAFRALADDYSTDAELSKTIPSGFSKDVKALESCLTNIKKYGKNIETSAPYDYYAFLELPRNAVMEDIGEALNKLKAERTEATQNSPANTGRYRAADDLLIIAKAWRVFGSEASRASYDAELERHERSFLALALSGEFQNTSISQHQFEEREQLDAVVKNALDAMACASGIVRVMNSALKNILEYYTERKIDAKVILDRDTLVSLFQPTMFNFYECIEKVVKGAGWKMEEVGKIVFAGGFSQSCILTGAVKTYMHDISKDALAFQSVSIDFAARGALLNAKMLTGQS